MVKTRLGRGVDYEHRYRGSRWAEDRLITAFRSAHLVPVRLGMSGVTRDNRVSSRKGDPKVPDLLVFDPAELSAREQETLRGLRYDLRQLTPAQLASRSHSFVFRKALAAIEVEFSPYRASEMTAREWKRKSPDALAKRSFVRATPPTAPNVFIKHEDLEPLRAWERTTGVRIVVMHVFDQEVFAVRLSLVSSIYGRLRRQNERHRIQTQLATGVFMTLQTYDRSDAQGAAERKLVFRVAPCAAVLAGTVAGVRVGTLLGLSKSKKYVASVVFRGGQIRLTAAFIDLIHQVRQ